MEAIIELLRKFQSEGLHDEGLLTLFLQHAHSAGKQKELGELAFHGKYLRNIYITIRRQTQESELYEKLESEFARAVNDFHGMLSAFIADGDEEFCSRVQQHALAVSEAGLKQLLELAGDFATLKNMEIELTHGGEDPAPTAQ
ncbi:MAG: hypothetical protein KFH87_03095 [Bacteroidetes bacterium]|nr:hypothetical protein [Bacteroidota bacterium]